MNIAIMKTFKNLIKIYLNYMSKKSRLRSVQLALKTNTGSQNIVDVADKIEKYVNEGL